MDVLEQFGINGKLLVIQVINFSILLFVLKKLLYKPVIDILEKRRTAVAQSVQASVDMKQEKEEFKENIDKEMDDARVKAQEVVTRAQEQASSTIAHAQADATKKSEELVAQAKKSIAAEKNELMKGVEAEIITLVTQATGKVLGKEVEGKHDALIKTEIAQK